MSPIIPQIIGIAAVVLFFSSYQIKHRKGIITVNVVSRVLYILQYILLGAFSGAVLDVMGALISVIAGKKEKPFIKKNLKAIIVITNSLTVVAGVVLAIISKNPLDFLALIGLLLQSGAFWLTEEKSIRFVSLFGAPFWFIYNLVSKAYGSCVGDLLTMISLIVAMIKYRNKEEVKSDETLQ